ncbi:hypothetical protein [Streptomyces sp. NPDC005548]
MTWPDGIAAAIGILTAYLLATPHRHTHRSTTSKNTPQDGDQQ